jgi:hypothetical protein
MGAGDFNIRMPDKRHGTSKASATYERKPLLLQGVIFKDEGRRGLQYQGLQKAWLSMEKKNCCRECPVSENV